MKKIILPVLLFIIVVVLVILFENKTNKSNKELYFSTALDKEYIYIKNGEKTPITITFSEDKVFGSAGINSYFAGYKVDNNNNVQFSPIGSTMMAGPMDEMEREREYLSLLNDVNVVKVYKDRMELITKNNVVLTFIEAKNEQSLEKESDKDGVIIGEEANLPKVK